MKTTTEERNSVELLRTFLPVLDAYIEAGDNPVVSAEKMLPNLTTIVALLDAAYPVDETVPE